MKYGSQNMTTSAPTFSFKGQIWNACLSETRICVRKIFKEYLEITKCVKDKLYHSLLTKKP